MVKIEVTQADIRRGKYQSQDSCPILFAARRAFKGTALKVTGVFESEMEFNEEWLVKLPPSARYFIAEFDAGADYPGDPTVGRKAVKPFAFSVSMTMPKAGNG